MHVLANGAGRNLRSTIMNHLKIRIMKKKLPSLFLGAMSILCAVLLYLTTPAYFHDVCELHDHLTFENIDWWLTLRNAAGFTGATILMLMFSADAVLGVILSFQKWNED